MDYYSCDRSNHHWFRTESNWRWFCTLQIHCNWKCNCNWLLLQVSILVLVCLWYKVTCTCILLCIQTVAMLCRNATNSYSQFLAKCVSYLDGLLSSILVPWSPSTLSPWKTISWRARKLHTSYHVFAYDHLRLSTWTVRYGLLVLSIVEMADWSRSTVYGVVQLLLSTEGLALCGTTSYHAHSCVLQFSEARLPTNPLDTDIWFSFIHVARSRCKC